MTLDEASNILNDYDINFDGHTAEEIAEAFDMAIKAIRTIPKTEGARGDIPLQQTIPKMPQPKRGRWIEVIDEIDSFGNKTWHHKCSICENTDSGWGQYKYCPECGAKMEGGKRMNTDEGRYKIDTSYVEKLLSESPKWEVGQRMNELTEIKQRILARIEMYIGDMELATEQELTEDEKTILESVKDIINSEFAREFNTQLNTEHIIKSTIKEYIGEFYLDTDELLLTLSKDLCERIKKGE